MANNEEILAELDRIKRSFTFKKSTVALRILEYLLTKFIEDAPDEFFKETVVGITIYGDDYDPLASPKVRVAYGRLRVSLMHYYETEGTQNPVRIALPPSKYRPVVSLTAPQQEQPAQTPDSPPQASPPPTRASIPGVEMCLRVWGEINSRSTALIAEGPSETRFDRYEEIETRLEIADCLLEKLIGFYRSGWHEIYYADPPSCEEEIEHRRMHAFKRFLLKFIDVFEAAQVALELLDTPADDEIALLVHSELAQAKQVWSLRNVYRQHLQRELQLEKSLELPSDLIFSTAGTCS